MIAPFGVPAHAGTAAGSAGSRRPSPTSTPTAACTIDLAVLHEISGVSGPTATSSGWNRLPGWTP